MARKRTAEKGDDAYARMLDVELPQEAPELNGLSLASFFCGCGGVDLGFRSAGFELAFANDLYERATESFKANLSHQPKLCDIRKVDPFKDIPEVDVLTGGFPCVSFSSAGARKGVEDTINGMLYMELCRMIEQRNPKYFVAENVRGMLMSNGGSDIKLILAAFLRLGYRTTYQLINMAEHGVPQTRERVIFVGIRSDQWRGTFRYPEKTHRLRKDTKAKKWLTIARTLRQAIGDLPGVGAMVVCNHDQISGAGETHYGVGERRRIADAPSVTIASVAGSGVPWAPPDGAEHNIRRMTVRECARVQSFPDWY